MAMLSVTDSTQEAGFVPVGALRQDQEENSEGTSSKIFEVIPGRTCVRCFN